MDDETSERLNTHKLRVRTATPKDIHGIMDLALAAVEDNGLAEASPHDLLNEIWPSLHLDRGIMGVVDEEPLRAAALLRVDRIWYRMDRDWIVERAIFVHPEARAAKGGRARLLCQWVKDVQQSLSMPLIVGILSTERTEAKVKLYERQFGKASGAYWIVGAATGA